MKGKAQVTQVFLDGKHDCCAMSHYSIVLCRSVTCEGCGVLKGATPSARTKNIVTRTTRTVTRAVRYSLSDSRSPIAFSLRRSNEAQ